MIANLSMATDDQVVRFLEEYFKRFDVRLTDGEIIGGCRLLVWGRDEIVLESDRGDKYLVPRHSISYIILEKGVAEVSSQEA